MSFPLDVQMSDEGLKSLWVRTPRQVGETNGRIRPNPPWSDLVSVHRLYDGVATYATDFWEPRAIERPGVIAATKIGCSVNCLCARIGGPCRCVCGGVNHALYQIASSLTKKNVHDLLEPDTHDLIGKCRGMAVSL